MSFAWPATGAFAVTPNDSSDLAKPVRALYIGVTGDVTVTFNDGTTQLFANVPVGVLPVQVKRVHSTGTTATGIVGLL